MGKIPALTSIRFIAAFAVFLEHWLILGGLWAFHDKAKFPDSVWFFGSIHESPILSIIFELRFGVTIFFVLSGFLLGARYFHSIFRKQGFLDYWIKRFARIMPLYWFLLAIMFADYVFFQVNDHWRETGKYAEALKYWPTYVTVTQGFFEKAKWLGNETAWSLTVEESFYILLPFLILSFRWAWEWEALPKVGKFLITGTILSTVTILLYWAGLKLHEQTWFTYAGFMRSVEDLHIYTIFGRFFDFAVGIMFGMLFIRTGNRLLTRRWLTDVSVVGSVIGILAMILIIRANGGLESKTGWMLNSVCVLFSGVIIYGLCSPVSRIARFLSWRPFVYLGEISYALYLVHKSSIVNEWYGGIINFLKDDLGMGTFGITAGSIIALYVIFTLLSMLCYEIIERPFQHLILARTIGRMGIRRPTLLRIITGKRKEDLVPHRVKKQKVREKETADSA